MSRRHPIFAAGVAALAAMALVWSMWPAGSGRVPTVEAAHVITGTAACTTLPLECGGSGAARTVPPGKTGIVVTIVGTVPANVSAAHFSVNYDAALLVATAGSCGDATAPAATLFPGVILSSGNIDIGCGSIPVIPSIYQTGGLKNLATITFTALGVGGVSTQTAVAWELKTDADVCIQGHNDTNCTTAGSNGLGTIEVVIPPGATNTFTPTATFTPTNTPTPTHTPTPCNTPTGGGSPTCPVSTAIVGAGKTATPTGTRTVLATETAAAVPTGSAPAATATKPGGGAGAGVTGPDTGSGGGSGGSGMSMLIITLIAAAGVASVTSGGWYWLRVRPRR